MHEFLRRFPTRTARSRAAGYDPVGEGLASGRRAGRTMCWIFLRVQVFLCLRSAIDAWSGTNLVTRSGSSRGVGSVPILALTLLSVGLSAAAQIALKVGVSDAQLQALLASGRLSSFIWHAALTPWVVGGILMYVLSAVTWLFVLARADLSFAYPFVSLAFVVTAMYGAWALHEPVGLARMGGVGLIVGGVLLMARS